MRLTETQIDRIRRIVAEMASPGTPIRLFGSRVDDAGRGGDVDLLIDLPHAVDSPAMLGSRIAARISRSMDGRKVDVVVAAPNLREGALHLFARARGVLL
jgi:predicted nucleotidyltransferase